MRGLTLGPWEGGPHCNGVPSSCVVFSDGVDVGFMEVDANRRTSAGVTASTDAYEATGVTVTLVRPGADSGRADIMQRRVALYKMARVNGRLTYTGGALMTVEEAVSVALSWAVDQVTT